MSRVAAYLERLRAERPIPDPALAEVADGLLRLLAQAMVDLEAERGEPVPFDELRRMARPRALERLGRLLEHAGPEADVARQRVLRALETYLGLG